MQETQETHVWSLSPDDFPGGGHGNPLRCSCLENPMDRGACWATVHGVTKSRTRLSDFTHSALLTMLKPLTVWITTNCGKFWKRWEYQTTLPASWETCMQVKKQQLELDMEQKTGSKLGKEYVKAVYCNLAYLTSMQSASCEMSGFQTKGWMKHKLESRLQGEISIASVMQMTPPLRQTVKRN